MYPLYVILYEVTTCPTFKGTVCPPASEYGKTFQSSFIYKLNIQQYEIPLRN